MRQVSRGDFKRCFAQPQESSKIDHLAKPFSVRELKARVNAIFRRPRRGHGSQFVVSERLPEGHEVLCPGVLTLDVDGHRALRDDEEMALTPTEFGLLATDAVTGA